MNILGLILSGLKAPAESVVTQLKDNAAGNIADIQKTVAAGGATAAAALEVVVAGIVGKNAELNAVYNAFVKGPLTAFLASVPSIASGNILTAYNDMVNFLEKEVNYL